MKFVYILNLATFKKFGNSSNKFRAEFWENVNKNEEFTLFDLQLTESFSNLKTSYFNHYPNICNLFENFYK